MNINLLNLTPDQLRNMTKEEVHEGYKKMLSKMLTLFYLDAMKISDQFETLADIQFYVAAWIEKNIKPPQDDWQPGDSGK